MITCEEARAALDYDPETGVLVWRINRKSNKVKGMPAGWLSEKGYICLCYNNIDYLAHRIIWLIYYGQWPNKQIDHINQDRSDNRISNLRDVSALENNRNHRLHKTNTSGVMGIYWDKQKRKWRARITVNGKKKSLGLFNDWLDAVSARKAAENKCNYHPNHGRKK